MPYYIGDVIKDYKKLVIRTPEDFQKNGINVKIRTRVEDIDSQKGLVRLSDDSSLPFDILVMATGADAVRLDIPGADLDGVFVLRNLMDALRLKTYLNEKECRKAVIIGGGYIGMEMCEAMKNLGIQTTVLDMLPRPVIRWDAEFAKLILDELGKNNVPFLPETRPLAIEKGTGSRLALKTDKGDLDADVILMGVGTRRSVALAKAAGIEMGESGAIKVDFRQQTSREGIYAVGDCCEVFHKVAGRWVYYPLGDIANKQGRVAGQNIGGRPTEFPGIVGAQSFKVFNLEVGATGLTEEEALTYGFQPVSAMIWGLPIGRPMAKGEKLGVKLVADKTTGRLLGGQCIGEKGAIQRIVGLSVALWSGLPIEEVGYLDLPYAPPFGGAWDAIHVAAQELMKKM
ncbi:MAG: FAD-dependent oxidoreductase [Syntrophales bacterium]|jgi:NADPH-dependent 2,4-dienoyl-CoA reductase/sulfur reductase-like enzyme|nr:FAD-dependent oxidoreductase [Syntrophales bacterium]MCK9390465.1 FAD-dependent oxidoreductase [Syntrophales bacterium]